MPVCPSSGAALEAPLFVGAELVFLLRAQRWKRKRTCEQNFAILVMLAPVTKNEHFS